jgi:hypothetical protein
MRRWWLGPCLAGALLVAAAPAPARAQSGEMPAHDDERRLAIGGDIGVTIAPADTRTYFNYTSYDEDVLRMARLQLYGEWHLQRRLSIVGELRTENLAAIRASALYLRWQPEAVRNLSIQIGRIPPVIGAFGRRAYSRDNAVLGLPLAYQYLTPLRPDALPNVTSDLLAMRGRGWQPAYPSGSTALRPGVPLAAGSTWDTGAEANWTRRWLDLSGAVTLGSPADPRVVDTNRDLMWSGRAAATLPGGVIVGLSGARAGWIADDALRLTPAGIETPHTQTLVGADTELGVGRWLVRAEWLRSSFDVPFVLSPNPVQRLTAQSGFVEGRVKLHPRVQIGVRVDRLTFSRLVDPATAASLTWDANVDRVEGVVSVRLSRNLEIRAGWQENRRQAPRGGRRGLPMAGLLYWF